MKYRVHIELLDNDVAYSPAGVVENAEKKGLFAHSVPSERNKTRRRMRHSLARFAINHKFPAKADGLAEVKGQSPVRAWFGRRWKSGLQPL